MPRKQASVSMPRTVTAMLKADHKNVKAIFDKWEKSRGGAKSQDLMQQAIDELKVHTTIEEEIFYPAAREATEEDLMNEAEEEHHVAKILIEEIEAMDMSDPRAEAKFMVLAESVRHHIREEESEMFPEISDEDFNRELVPEMWERKQELMSGNAAPRASKPNGKSRGASAGR